MFIYLTKSYNFYVACTCNRDGTSDEICDLESGCCDCKDGVIGEKCQFCSPGKYGFPECKGMKLPYSHHY